MNIRTPIVLFVFLFLCATALSAEPEKEEAKHVVPETKILRDIGQTIIPGLEDYAIGCGPQANSVIASLAGAMRVMGEDYTYDNLMGISGAAFRIQVAQPAWCPTSPHADCGFPTGDIAQKTLPYTFVDHQIKQDPDRYEKARAAVVATIDRGIPALVSSEETGLVLGHAVLGTILLCRPPYAGKSGYVELREEGGICCSATLKDSTTKVPWVITTLEPGRKAPPRRKLYVQALARAVKLANTKKYKGHPDTAKDFYYASGFNAYKLWIKQLRHSRRWKNMDHKNLQGAQLANSHTYYNLIDARRTAAKFLRQVSAKLGREGDKPLIEAAALYEKMVNEHLAKEPPAKIAPTPFAMKEGETWTQEMRNSQADILEATLKLEREAVRCIASALKRKNRQRRERR